MRACDIDLKKLKCLIDSVPSGVEVESITFNHNEIQLHIIAGTAEIKQQQYNEALAELNLIRDRLNKLENETKRLT